MDRAIRNRTAIVGVGYTPVLRHAQRNVGAIAVDAALAAIEDAGLRRDDIDGFIGLPFGPTASAQPSPVIDQISAAAVVSGLGLNDPRFVVDIAGMPNTALVMAVQALCSGLCTNVLIARAVYNQPSGRRAETAGLRSAAGAAQYTLPYGLSGGGAAQALALQRYMHEYGATREELFAVVNADHRHAQLNPVAYWRGREVTLEDYLYCRFIAQPLCLFDCDMPVTTAGAIVVTTAERARNLPHPPAYITAFAGINPTEPDIFEVSGVERQDVQVAQIYDGFSPFVWYWLETLGYCGKGEAHAYTQGGRIELGGELPVNTFGGNLGEGHFQGFGHLREGAMQIMGRCGERQVHDVRHCLVALGIPNGSRSRYVIMLSSQ